MHFKFLKTLQHDKLLNDLRYQGDQTIDLALRLLSSKSWQSIQICKKKL